MAKHFLALSPAYLQNLRRLALFIAMLMSGGNPIFPRIPLLIILLALCVIYKGPTLGLRREMGAVGLLLLAIFGIAVIGADTAAFVAIATRYANFFAGLVLLGLYIGEPRNTLSRDVLPIFRGMGFQILATVALWIFIPQLFETRVADDSVYQTIFWVFTYHVNVVNDTSLIRPDGFFWEPGVFQIYMNIYLFIALFVRKSRFDTALAIISVLFLQSTVGLLTAIILLGAAALQAFNTSGAGIRVLGLLVAPLVAVPLLFVAVDNFTTKTTGALRGSSWARAYDFYTGVNVIKEHPLVGLGFDNERYVSEANRLGYDEGPLDYRATADRSNSNGLITLIVNLGIPLSIPFLFAIFRQRFFQKQYLFGALLVLSFMNEALILTPFFLMLLFSAMILQSRRKAHPDLVALRQRDQRSRSHSPNWQSSDPIPRGARHNNSDVSQRGVGPGTLQDNRA